MIWETCAPESENVTTECLCFIISSTSSKFSLNSGWTKNSLRSRSSATSISASTGSTPRSRAISAMDHRPRGERVGQLALHHRQVLGGGRLGEGALAHGVGAQRRVADVARVVDPLRPAGDGV